MPAINEAKKAFLKRIRSETSYPTFRSFVGVIAVLFYIAGVLNFLGGVFFGMDALQKQGPAGIGAILIGLLVGVICLVVGMIIKEAAPMLADVADSVTDILSKHED